MFKKLLFFSLLIALAQNSFAQKFTVSGYVSDSSSKENLIGATIYATEAQVGTATNNYGFFSITLPAAEKISLSISYIGYQTKNISLKLDKDFSMTIPLLSSITLGAVTVSADAGNKIQDKTQMSQITIPIDKIKSIPALLGEVDVLKALQLLPGVQSGGEGSDGLYVRGGGPDQNLILLDGTPVYNVSHLFGFFSVFNADAIKNVTLTTGGFPARYGGRLSSVIDIAMKEGDMKKFHGEGTIGLIASKLTLEGPIKKDKLSFIVSARRTYVDVLAQPIIATANSNSGAKGTGGYYFYDLNGKLNWKISDKDHLYLSYYSGDDKFYARSEDAYTNGGFHTTISDNYKLGWGNVTGAFRWNHVLGKKFFCNTSVTYTRFKFIITAKESVTDLNQATNQTTVQSNFIQFFSGIQDWAAKVDFDYIPSPKHYIKFGVSHIYHTFNTGATQFQFEYTGSTPIDTIIGTPKINAQESSAYIEDDWMISKKLKINYGVHISNFYVNKTDYPSVQPRISARFLLNENKSLKASFATMQQNIHLLTNSGIGLPTDLWVPATEKIKPQTSWIAAIGYAQSFKVKKDFCELSIEGYYKDMNHIIDYLGGASFLGSNTDWENKVEAGRGWSYGAEVMLQKKTGRFSGWIGYTLSWTNRKFPTINNGNVFPYKYDRRHDGEIVVSYLINEHTDIAATWVYGTGNAITMAIATYPAVGSSFGGSGFGGGTIEYYGDKNSIRMKSYQRADIGINFHKKTKWGERTWNIGAYNVYSRKNPYFYYIGYDLQGNKHVKMISLFPIIPSVAFSFKF